MARWQYWVFRFGFMAFCGGVISLVAPLMSPGNDESYALLSLGLVLLAVGGFPMWRFRREF